MNTLSKTALAPVFALASVASFTTAAFAGEGSDDIVVTSQAAMDEWKASTNRELSRALQRAPLPRTAVPGSGIVQVTFTLGADGRPEDVELHSSTANWAAEHTARFAVRSLGDLSDVPVSNSGSAQFLANIIFADNAREHEELKAKLARFERARLASETAESDYISLGG